MRHDRVASVRSPGQSLLGSNPVFDPVQFITRGDLREMEVYHTLSFICKLILYPSCRVSTLSWLNANILAQDAHDKVRCPVSGCWLFVCVLVLPPVQFIYYIYSIFIYVYNLIDMYIYIIIFRFVIIFIYFH